MREPELSKDFVWRYDLEEEEFVRFIFSMAQPIHLWDAECDYSELLRDNPHRAYVIAIENFMTVIVNRFKSLNLLDRMFAYDSFPISTPEGSIFRYDWIRILLDVLLSRLTSIRDCCFLFAAELYELGLDPRRVNLAILERSIGDKEVTVLLKGITDAARGIRDERDRHLHRGEQRELTDESDQIFELLSRAEGESHPRFAFTKTDGTNHSVEMDLAQMHSKAIEKIRNEYHREGDQLLKLTRELFIASGSEFEKRWAKKRDVAKCVRSWEGP
jgi:hypothetical protein